MKTSQHPLSIGTTRKYLDILKVKETSQKDLHYLRELLRAHLHTIPYENFSKYHYVQNGVSMQYIYDTEEFINCCANLGWGGTCYPLNIHFAKLLNAIGYNASLVRVRTGHVAIMVHYEQEQYYVDVGYGAPLFSPVQLREEGQLRIKKLGEEIFIKKVSPSLFEIDRHADGKSFVKKEIDWRPLSLEDFGADIEHSHLDESDNIVMRRLSATIFKPRYCYYLNNETITRKNEYTKEVSKFTDRKNWAANVYQVFGIEEEASLGAAAFLEKRGVKLFKD
ncbi:arylamine N-acetyltransferase [Pseudalkalibacillus sp. R45]|uniref:arylamine N-acetyltransferase n=1 Tax=Pseudalkalibacillus sp. R45 TaxID=3457433 RepID=UPI003FCCBC75